MHPRLKAGLVHMGLSAIVAGIALAVAFLTWYPTPYARLMGVPEVSINMISLALFGGPLLTAVVWKAGKWGLGFDLWVIAFLQLGALGYGLHGLYVQRPLYTVFTVDRFNVQNAERIDPETPVGKEWQLRPWQGPMLVAALVPTDPVAYDRLLTETLFEGKPDIDRRPEFWQPYNTVLQQVQAAGLSLQRLIEARPEQAEAVGQAAQRLGVGTEALKFLPIIGAQRDMAAVIEPGSAKPVVFIDVDPWIQP